MGCRFVPVNENVHSSMSSDVHILWDDENERFLQKLRDHNPHAETGIQIRVDGVPLDGTNDFDMVDFVIDNVARMLDGVEPVLDGERWVVPYRNMPGDLVFEPGPAGTTTLWYEFAEEGKVPESGVAVDRDDLVRELLDTGEALLEFVMSQNSDLENTAPMRRLMDSLSSARNAYSTHSARGGS